MKKKEAVPIEFDYRSDKLNKYNGASYMNLDVDKIYFCYVFTSFDIILLFFSPLLQQKNSKDKFSV